MTTRTGSIGVTTENIFPVIKKFLYSDHEIFLRELVSNAIDATQKLKTLASVGEFKGDLGEMKVTVTADKDKGTLTVSDYGIGMTADDIDKYINQIAFSGAEEFLEKYKDTANSIIGHFGLGFYSAFMVAKKVEICSRSWKDGAKGVKWSCDGSPEFKMEDTERAERGTDIILYIDDESKKFLEAPELTSLLRKYCRFLPVPVEFEGKIINDTEPAWTKKPADLTDKDYLDFYHELYPGQEDPLFWIHLNVDYPFTLTGILFFPKIKNNIEVAKNRIQLYCNQVFVTDSVEGVVPEFMMLLQGVIDSPDIPLNVSRSYLQSDSAVKKISGYITKKVASRLDDIFKASRKEFEGKWNDIRIFIEYGMLTDDKFCEHALKFTLLEDTEKNYYTLEEYCTLISSSQTDKDSNVVYLYTTDPVAQYDQINSANAKGYNVILLDGQLDSHFIGLLENKIEKSRFVRVDSDVTENLIPTGDKKEANLTAAERTVLSGLFRCRIPKVDNSEFLVTFETLGAESAPVSITRNEYMRRMKDMAAMQPGMGFYAQLPDSYNLVVNIDNPVVAAIKGEADKTLIPEVKPMLDEMEAKNSQVSEIRTNAKDGKLSDEDNKQIAELEKAVEEARKKETEAVEKYASTQQKLKQVIDLALLANGLLRGAELTSFIKRSVDLLK